MWGHCTIKKQLPPQRRRGRRGVNGGREAGAPPVLGARRLATARARNGQKEVVCPADEGEQDTTLLLGAVVLQSNTTISTVALFLALAVGGGKRGMGERAVRGFPPILRPWLWGAVER